MRHPRADSFAVARARFALAAALAGALAASAQAARRDWVGTSACGSCHPAQLAAWQETAHARPFPVAPASLARCATCHSTGEWPSGPVTEPVVGCEACHGAGADYAFDDIMRNPLLAADLGLIKLGSPAVRAATCAACHGPVSLGSAGAAALAKPAHPIATKPASPAGAAP